MYIYIYINSVARSPVGSTIMERKKERKRPRSEEINKKRKKRKGGYVERGDQS